MAFTDDENDSHVSGSVSDGENCSIDMVNNTDDLLLDVADFDSNSEKSDVTSEINKCKNVDGVSVFEECCSNIDDVEGSKMKVDYIVTKQGRFLYFLHGKHQQFEKKVVVKRPCPSIVRIIGPTLQPQKELETQQHKDKYYKCMLLLLLPHRNFKDLKGEALDWEGAFKNAKTNGKIGEHELQLIVNQDDFWYNKLKARDNSKAYKARINRKMKELDEFDENVANYRTIHSSNSDDSDTSEDGESVDNYLINDTTVLCNEQQVMQEKLMK